MSAMKKHVSRTDALLVALLALVVLATVLASLIGIAPWANSVGEKVVVHVVLAIVAALLFVTYLRLWAKNHAKSVGYKRRLDPSEIPEFRQLTWRQARLRIEEEAKSLGLADLSQDDATKLCHHLVSPRTYRAKVFEDVELHVQQQVHRVEIDWSKDSAIKLVKSRLIPIMRPFKDDEAREVVIEGARLLTSLETAALLYESCLSLMLPRRLGENEKDSLVKLITASPNTPNRSTNSTALLGVGRQQQGHKAVSRIKRVWLQAIAHDRNLQPTELKNLLDILETRRPYVAIYDSPKAINGKTTFRYRTNPIPWVYSSKQFDRWRIFKDQLRRMLFMPPRIATVDLERAISAERFQLHIECDSDVYIEEAEVLDELDGAWLPRLSRKGMYSAYLGWEAPSAKSFMSLGAARLASVKRVSRPMFVLRLTEKPPGALASATSVSFATLVAVWLVGWQRVGNSADFDPVALVLALPAVASTALGLFSTGEGRELKSGTAIGSLLVSCGISLAAVLLYVTQMDPSASLVPAGPAEEGRGAASHSGLSVLGMESGWWICLFLVAVFALLIVLGTFVLRLGRYSVLLGARRPILREDVST